MDTTVATLGLAGPSKLLHKSAHGGEIALLYVDLAYGLLWVCYCFLQGPASLVATTRCKQATISLES